MKLKDHVLSFQVSELAHIHVRMHVCIRDDYKFAKMIGQKPLIAILPLHLVKHPVHYIREIMYK